MQIAILLYPGVTALDAVGPYEVLSRMPGADVRFVAKEAGPIADGGVLLLGATHTLAETPSPDIVLVPGGETTPSVMVDKDVLNWLRHVHENTRWTASVCTGALILAAAGILDGKPATTHWYVMGPLKRMGAVPRPDDRIVETGSIVTAAGVSAGIDLALWLAGKVVGREQAEGIQLTIEYDPHPPFDAGHTSKASPAVRAIATEIQKRRTPVKQRVVRLRVAWDRMIAVIRSKASG